MTVGWDARALADIAKLVRYIGIDNPSAAARLARRILAAGESLLIFPLRGRPGQETGTRELVVVQPYILVYQVVPEGTVTILRVWHAAQSRRPNA